MLISLWGFWSTSHVRKQTAENGTTGLGTAGSQAASDGGDGLAQVESSQPASSQSEDTDSSGTGNAHGAFAI